MATIRKHWNKWQVLIRRQGHPHIAKSFTSHSDATKYAQESETNIEKGIEDMTEEERDKFELDEGRGLEKAQEEIDQILEDFYEVEL